MDGKDTTFKENAYLCSENLSSEARERTAPMDEVVDIGTNDYERSDFESSMGAIGDDSPRRHSVDGEL